VLAIEATAIKRVDAAKTLEAEFIESLASHTLVFTTISAVFNLVN